MQHGLGNPHDKPRAQNTHVNSYRDREIITGETAASVHRDAYVPLCQLWLPP
jgi:hypothetical protein